MSKEFKIDELEERIAPSSLNVGSILGGAVSAANGSPTTSAGSVGDVSTGHIGSMNSVDPVLNAINGNNLDAVHGNSLTSSAGNVMGNSPSTGISPNVMPNLDLDTSGGSSGSSGGLL